MKRITILFAALAVFLWVGSAGAFYISDTYIGADPTHNWPHIDVIGADSQYDIQGMDVSFSNGQMIVDIYSSYFDNIGSDGTTLGDLFISTNGYNPVTPSGSDDAFNGEKWEFVAVLDNHNETASSGKIVVKPITYSSSASNGLSDDITLSNLGGLNPNNWVYRADQEVQYTGALGDASSGSWLIPTTENYLEFSIAMTGSEYDWTSVEEFGFHWGMTCANDVIEGSAPVPEPATMFLFGTGLIGLAAVGRKKLIKQG